MKPLQRNTRSHKNVIILAYDGMPLKKAIELTAALSKRMYAVKIHSLYDEVGKDAIDELKKAGAAKVWDDAKLHDIPDTVGYRAKAIFGNGADMLTVHASGDIQMMRAACMPGKEVYGISVLTSLDAAQSEAIYNKLPAGEVLTLARFAKLAGLSGLVCSAQELEILSKMPELTGLKLVVPGTRSIGADLGNQKRVLTPGEAILAGATHLVIGTQVTKAEDPIAAFNAVATEIDEALAELEKQTVVSLINKKTKVFSINDENKLRNISRADFGPIITDEAFDHVFKTAAAMWLHDKKPDSPHAILTTGKHSNGFVDTLRVLKNTNLCEIFAEEMAEMYKNYARKTGCTERPDWVIGSDHAGATLSLMVALKLGSQHDFTEKGDGKTQVWKRFAIKPGETVLQVEELITTTSTLDAVRKGIIESSNVPINFLPVTMTLIHRSPTFIYDGDPILHLRHYEIAAWEASECPLCKEGSEAIKEPKKNWSKLTGTSVPTV
jgi:orotidine-5'-phosphate decarboxylase